MMRSRLGLRAIGLCLALAGLMAVGASSAQAEAGSYWLVNGAKVTNALKAELAGALENNHGVLLGSIGGVGIHILCTGVTFVSGSGSLLIEGGLSGKVQFKGCSILRLKEGKAETLGACKPPEGLITSTTGKGLIRLSGGSPVTVLEPASGTTFTTISTGEECAFGESIQIGGKLGVQDTEGAFLTDQVTHLITEHAATTELYINGNKANKATIDGSATITLSGAHTGLKWSGHPA